MATKQDVFDLCKSLYLKSVNNVKAMAVEIAKIAEKDGIDIDPKAVAGEFDVVLQYSLLQVAVADFELDADEIIFIRDLTEYGDFVNYCSSEKFKLTWEMLYNASINDVRKLLKSLEDIIKDLSGRFVRIFAICDAATEYNFVSDLEDYLNTIITGLSLMDGDQTSDEKEVQTVIMSAVRQIKKLKKQ